MFYPQGEDHYRELRLYCGSPECLIQRPGQKPLPRKQTIGYLVYMTDDPVIPEEGDDWYFWTFRLDDEGKPGALTKVLACPRCGLRCWLTDVEPALNAFFIDSHTEAKQTSLFFLCERGLAERLDISMPKSRSELEELEAAIADEVRQELISEFESWAGPDGVGDDWGWYKPDLPPGWR